MPGADTGNTVRRTYIANSNSNTYQYHFVKSTSATNFSLANSNTDVTNLGLLANEPLINEHGSVVITGRYKVYAGAAIAVDKPITTTTSGRATAIASGAQTVCFGFARQAASADGELISVDLITPKPWGGGAV